MASFLDGFADSFTNSYNAVTSRRSDKERTALGYEELEERRRSAGEEERLAGERLDVERGQLDVQRGQLDVQRSAETRAQEDAPSERAAREAQTRVWVADAINQEYLNSDKGREEVRRRMESDIRLQDAQTAQAQQAVKNAIQEEALAAYKNTDAYRELEEDSIKAATEANRGAGAKSAAEAATIVEGNALGTSRLQQELQEQMDIEADAAGVPRRRVTRSDTLYAKAHGEQLPWEVGEVAEGAIPEGEAAAPAEEPTAEEPEPDPDQHDEPVPGEGPDEPYMGDGPLQNAPIPAPSREPGPDQNMPSTPVASTEAPTSKVTTPDAPTAQTSLTSSTGRTLAEYSAMSRQELGALPPSEYNEYLDLLDAAQAPVTAPAGAAIPVTGAPAGATPGPTAGPATRSTTGARPEYTEQQAGYSTATAGPTAGPATRPTQAPVGAAPQIAPPAATGSLVIPPALAPYVDMTREQLAALPPEEYQRYVSAYEDYAATLQNAARPGPTAGPALGATQAIPEAATPGPTAGPATRSLTALPPEARQAQAPAGGVTTPPLPARTPSPRPSRAPAHRPGEPLPSVEAGAPAQPLPNTYRATGSDVPGVAGVSYRPGEAGAGRVIEAQSGTRKLPLNDRTRTMMEQAAAQTGVTVKVTSGAQESSGSNRTGSHRHDSDVGAGDIQLIDEATGKPVSMRTPEGREKMLQFMRAARDAGATGFGAGLDYMGESTIHVGFGDPGVWGAGGKGANAPKWLKDGMNMGAGPSSQPQGTGSRPAGVSRAYQGLQARDMPQMQAAILAGNIQQESGGNPNSVNAKEGAEGIIQWRQDRLDKLKAFAGEKDYRDLDVQLDFLIQEGESLGSGQDKAAWQEFMSATTPEAANAALKKFIRYGDESAGTRLEYANNLLRGGGAEIRGEKGQAIPVTGESNRRLPTPRGEIQPVKRQMIIGGKEAMKIGAKAAVQQAGFARGPSAVPDVNSEAAKRAFVAGDPNSAGAVAKIHETAQKMIVSEDPKKPTKLSSAERQLNSAYRLYEYTLRTQGAEAAQQAMMGVYQAYKAIGSQQMAFAKQLTTQGRVDEAVKVAANAQAYFADGTDAKVSKDADGNFIISTKDLETGEITEQQMLTPEEAVRAITGWQSTDIEKQMLRMAGKPVQSGAMDAAQRQLTAPVEPPTPVTSLSNPGDVFARQAIPAETPIDTSRLGPDEQFSSTEQTAYTSGLAQRNAQIELANKAAQPPANVNREAIRAEIAALVETAEESLASEVDADGNPIPGSVGYSYQLAKDTYGNNLNSILTNVLQANPNEIAEQVVIDMAGALSASNADPTAERLPIQASRGDYEGMWKLNFVGSPTSYNVPSETAMAIRNGLMDKMQTEQEAFGKEVFETGRDAPKIAEEARLAKEGEEIHRGQERYTPQALGRKAGVKQGALPLGPPIWKMPGYTPPKSTTKYIEASPLRRR